MAGIYTRKDSPFVWIKYKLGGEIIQESTKLRKKVVSDVRKARALAAQRTADELRKGSGRRKEGWAWVSTFLKSTYGSGNALTYRNYCQSWRVLSVFLQRSDIAEPAHLLRRHCLEYIAWRMEGDLGVRASKQGTALLEVHVLQLIMSEAIQRDLVNANPCANLKVKRQAPKVKPELTAEHCALIRKEIQNEKDQCTRDMLFYSFEISRHQGCRLMESRLNPQEDIKIAIGPNGVKRGTIFFRAKGGKQFTTALHPALIPMFERLIAKGRTYTWQDTERRGYTWAAATWYRFLERIGLKEFGATIHSNRVTVITELARANVPMSKAMAICGHSTSAIHRIYQRIVVDDLSDSIALVGNRLANNSDASSGEPASMQLPHRRQTGEPSDETRPPT